MSEDRPLDDPIEAIRGLKAELEDLRGTLQVWTKRRPTGDIEPTLRATAKPGTLLLQGQTVSRADYPDLWEWVQANGQGGGLAAGFGPGNGTTTFTLPDMRGRVLVGAGAVGGSGTNHAFGAIGGLTTVQLTVAEMPSHNHSISSGSTGSSGDHSGHFNASQVLVAVGPDYGVAPWNSSGTTRGSHSHGGISASAANTGGNQAHENRPPFLVGNWLIWT